jgi:hypothetical protein
MTPPNNSPDRIGRVVSRDRHTGIWKTEGYTIVDEMFVERFPTYAAAQYTIIDRQSRGHPCLFVFMVFGIDDVDQHSDDSD